MVLKLLLGSEEGRAEAGLARGLAAGGDTAALVHGGRRAKPHAALGAKLLQGLRREEAVSRKRVRWCHRKISSVAKSGVASI